MQLSFSRHVQDQRSNGHRAPRLTNLFMQACLIHSTAQWLRVTPRAHTCLLQLITDSSPHTVSHRRFAARQRPAPVFAARSDSMSSRTALEETSAGGDFKRTDAGFRSVISATNPRFLPEADRYHLYIGFACPWATRTLAVYYMKGLENVIGLSVTHPTWQLSRPGQDDHTGWMFTSPSDPPLSSSTGHGSFDNEGCIPDSINSCKFVRDLYEMAKDATGKYTVPVLWDKKEKTIVNNESSDIIRIFNSGFNSLANNPDLDLYPEALRPAIDAVNEWVYSGINNGVYRCGFATSQAAYDIAFRELCSALDRCESILGSQRYLAGNILTEADIRLFMTLIRFDEVYVVYFKTNHKFIHEYPNLKGFVQEMFQTPGVARTVNIKHIKTHYFTSHPKLNPYAIIPGGGEAWWEQPHTRAKQFPAAEL